MSFHIALVLLLICGLINLASGVCTRKIIPPSETSGFIRSPGYPYTYLSGQCINWFMYYNGDPLHVSIRILRLDLPTLTNDGHCSGASLSFGPKPRRNYCGNVTDVTYEADQNSFFYIMFNSSLPGPKGTGFLLQYTYSTQHRPGVFPTSRTSQAQNAMPEVTPRDFPSTNSTQNPYPHPSFTSKETRGTITLHTNQLISVLNNLQYTWLLTPKTFPRNGYIVYVLKFTFLNLFPGCSLCIFGGSDENGQFYKEITRETRAPQTVEIIGTSTFLKLTAPIFVTKQGAVGNFTMKYEQRVECKDGYNACGHNESLCYYFTKRCDRVWDCPESGGDEQDCSSSVSDNCESNQFSCMDKSGYCYSAADKCDGKVTCINNRDELDCSPDVCSPSKGLFLCKNRRCIYEKWTCDATDDCSDGSDEANCNSWESPRIILAAVVGSVLCSLFLVIAMSFACRVYALHNHRHRGEHGRETPLSRYEAELLRQRPPPPSYPEAMLTSRPYEEAYLELLNATGNNQLDDDGLPRYEQDPPHHSSHASEPSREPENSGRRRRQRRRRRHRNVQQSSRPGNGVLSTANQHCQLLLHRAGLAPPPYSLIHSSAEAEHSSSDIEDGGDGEEEGVHDVAPEVDDESPSEEISSLSSAETASHMNDPHGSSSPIFESNFSPIGEINSENAHTLDGTLGVDVSFDNCDKVSDDSSELSDSPADTEMVETSLSFTDANDGEMPIADVDKPDDEEERDEDSDDCPCILAEGNENVDESRNSGNDLDCECILNQ